MGRPSIEARGNAQPQTPSQPSATSRDKRNHASRARSQPSATSHDKRNHAATRRFSHPQRRSLTEHHPPAIAPPQPDSLHYKAPVEWRQVERQVRSLQIESRRAPVPAQPRVVRRCSFASCLAAPVGWVECEVAGARSAMLRCAPARPPSACSLRFAPVRARGDTDAGLQQVAIANRPMGLVGCSNRDVAAEVLGLWHSVAGYVLAREMTATCTSSSGEVQHLLIQKTDLEQYAQHAGESSNCLDPGTEPAGGCKGDSESARVDMGKR
jgi:hypothetical protein